jgi:hypothetical protein
MFPHAILEITDSSRRLEKILRLARSCDYSVHDLSRGQLDRAKPRVPRFNMPFELGLCVADANRQKGQKQNWFVFEAVANRVDKSLSDLKVTDPRIHGATVRGVMSGLCTVFRRPGRQPTVPQMMQIYKGLRKKQAAILKEAGSDTLYTRRVFVDVCWLPVRKRIVLWWIESKTNAIIDVRKNSKPAPFDKPKTKGMRHPAA